MSPLWWSVDKNRRGSTRSRGGLRPRPPGAIVERLEARTLLTVQVGAVVTTAGTPSVQRHGRFDQRPTGVSSSPAPCHLSGRAGSFPLTVTITGTGTSTAEGPGTATVRDAPLNSVGLTITPARGIEFSGTVATFTSTNPFATPSDFTASINFGDGTNTNVPGLIAPNGQGGFNVIGQNTYAEPGTFTTTVSIVSGTQSSVAKGSAVVSAQPVAVFGSQLTGGVGKPLSAVNVASFLDPYPNDPPTDFQATIVWGDGTTSPGAISGSNGIFGVAGTHTYSAPGTFTTSTQVTRLANGQAASAAGSAVISGGATAGAPLTGTPALIVPSVNVPFTGTVGSFTASNTTIPAGNFTAVITWGDGHTSSGNVSGTAGQFVVSGTNTYLTPGNFKPVILVQDNTGDSVSINSTAVVLGSTTLTPIPALISASAGVPFSGISVGSFLDTNPAALATDFTAQITWGDGHTSSGTVVAEGTPGRFNVIGGNTYAAAGTFMPSILVQDRSGNVVTITSTAAVNGLSLTAIGTTVAPTIAVPFSGTVATLIDSTPGDTAANLTATISWGNGNTSIGQVVAGSLPGHFNVIGQNLYLAAGSFPISVTIITPSGQTVTATSKATVIAPSLTAAGTTFPATPGQTLKTTVASFSDTNPTANAADISAVINWGNGETSVGTVLGPFAGSKFTVVGSFVYPSSSPAGSFPVTVTIVDPSGQSATATSTALLVNTGPSFAFTGALAPFSDTSPTHAGGFTNTNRPTFAGTAPPFAIVQLTARPLGIDASLPLGQAVASAAGNWTLATGPLANGIYIVTAIVTPPGGYPGPSTPLANNGQVVVDTSAPRVASITTLDGMTQVIVTLRTSVSALNLATLFNPANYLFTGPRGLKIHPAAVTPGFVAGLPAVVLTTTLNPKTRRKLSALTINGAAIKDMAGTSLQGALHASLAATAVKTKARAPRR